MRLTTLALILISFCACAQMKFNIDNDTMYVGIFIEYDCSYKLFVKANRDLTNHSLDIGFPDGSLQRFHQERYGVFTIPDKALIKLKENKFDYLSLESPGLSEPCYAIKTKEFFISSIK